MKTPEEIKKGLECCSIDKEYCDKECPYLREYHFEGEPRALIHDALAYTQQLERERDAAVKDMMELMRLAQFCRYCKHLTDDGECTYDSPDANVLPMRCWQWRGVQEVDQ